MQGFLRGLLDFFVARLGGGFFKVFAGFVDIFWYTLAVVVEDTEAVLGFGYALYSGFLVPRGRVRGVYIDQLP